MFVLLCLLFALFVVVVVVVVVVVCVCVFVVVVVVVAGLFWGRGLLSFWGVGSLFCLLFYYNGTSSLFLCATVLSPAYY